MFINTRMRKHVEHKYVLYRGTVSQHSLLTFPSYDLCKQCKAQWWATVHLLALRLFIIHLNSDSFQQWIIKEQTDLYFWTLPPTLPPHNMWIKQSHYNDVFLVEKYYSHTILSTTLTRMYFFFIYIMLICINCTVHKDHRISY